MKEMPQEKKFSKDLLRIRKEAEEIIRKSGTRNPEAVKQYRKMLREKTGAKRAKSLLGLLARESNFFKSLASPLKKTEKRLRDSGKTFLKKNKKRPIPFSLKCEFEKASRTVQIARATLHTRSEGTKEIREKLRSLLDGNFFDVSKL